jgi:hypothetical protein
MKTKIKSLIIICTLGLVGVLNANATLSYKISCIAGTLEEQTRTKSENLNSTGFVLNEDADAVIDYQMEAQLVTKWIVDNEEAETIQMLIDRRIFVSNDETASLVGESNLENLNSAEFEFSADAKLDYQLEAQLITKEIADNEEAETNQMLIDRGIFVSNDETASFVGESNLENLNSAEFDFTINAEIDNQLDAQLITKLIADNEEAKTIQKLIDEGKLVENK